MFEKHVKNHTEWCSQHTKRLGVGSRYDDSMINKHVWSISIYDHIWSVYDMYDHTWSLYDHIGSMYDHI